MQTHVTGTRGETSYGLLNEKVNGSKLQGGMNRNMYTIVGRPTQGTTSSITVGRPTQGTISGSSLRGSTHGGVNVGNAHGRINGGSSYGNSQKSLQSYSNNQTSGRMKFNFHGYIKYKIVLN